jgi:hypothetical protein
MLSSITISSLTETIADRAKASAMNEADTDSLSGFRRVGLDRNDRWAPGMLTLEKAYEFSTRNHEPRRQDRDDFQKAGVHRSASYASVN